MRLPNLLVMADCRQADHPGIFSLASERQAQRPHLSFGNLGFNAGKPLLLFSLRGLEQGDEMCDNVHIHLSAVLFLCRPL